MSNENQNEVTAERIVAMCAGLVRLSERSKLAHEALLSEALAHGIEGRPEQMSRTLRASDLQLERARVSVEALRWLGQLLGTYEREGVSP